MKKRIAQLQNQVKALRLTHKIATQTELARRTGIDAYAINRWERGHCQPSAAHARTLADFFGVTLDAIYGRVPPPLGGAAPAIVRKHKIVST